jgi:aspartyl/glutamyl-tRNA(Asn/Gln) amidotransferase C subunit
MEKETLRLLEMLNQLSLSQTEKDEVIAFCNDRENDAKALEAIDTANVERMVHVMPIMTVVREDVASQPFSRDDLQKGAPETDEGYWCVPRVVE